MEVGPIVVLIIHGHVQSFPQRPQGSQEERC